MLPNMIDPLAPFSHDVPFNLLLEETFDELGRTPMQGTNTLNLTCLALLSVLSFYSSYTLVHLILENLIGPQYVCRLNSALRRFEEDKKALNSRLGRLFLALYPNSKRSNNKILLLQ